jgi:hypothetical protein
MTQQCRDSYKVTPPQDMHMWPGAYRMDGTDVPDPAKRLTFDDGGNNDGDPTSTLSEGDKAARSLVETLASAVDSINWLPLEHQPLARTAVLEAHHIAKMPNIQASIERLARAVNRAVAPATYKPTAADGGDAARTTMAEVQQFHHKRVTRRLKACRESAQACVDHLRMDSTHEWVAGYYVCVMPDAAGPLAAQAKPVDTAEPADTTAPASASSSDAPHAAHAHLGGTGGDGVTQTMERGFSPDCVVATAGDFGQRRHVLPTHVVNSRGEAALEYMQDHLDRVADSVKRDSKRKVHALDKFVAANIPPSTDATRSCSGSKLVVFDDSNPLDREYAAELADLLPELEYEPGKYITSVHDLDPAAFHAIRNASHKSEGAKLLLRMANHAQAAAKSADIALRSTALFASVICKAIRSGELIHRGTTAEKSEKDQDLQLYMATALRVAQQNCMAPSQTQYKAVAAIAGCPDLVLDTDVPGSKRGHALLQDTDLSNLAKVQKTQERITKTLKTIAGQNSKTSREMSGAGGQQGGGTRADGGNGGGGGNDKNKNRGKHHKGGHKPKGGNDKNKHRGGRKDKGRKGGKGGG